MGRQRLVIKIGSSSLTNTDGSLSIRKLHQLTDAVVEVKRCGHEVILISSGAVAAGYSKMGYPSRPETVRAKQAAAAVGQNLLMQAYADAFSKEGIVTGQLLLTRQDFLKEESYSNAYNTLEELLKRNIVPVINENDSTVTDELTFGDNDMLSALVSGFSHADRLIILTDINGLYTDNPLLNPEAEKYTHINQITPDMMAQAGNSTSKVGTGGMKSKLEAVKTAHAMGVTVFLGKNTGTSPLLQILDGNGDGTYIYPDLRHTMKKIRHQWLAYHSVSKGALTIDKGAELAVLKNGKSLLPVGIISAEGHFSKGDVVDVFNENGQLIGRGKVSYNASSLPVNGNRSSAASAGKESEAIHRDQWISFKQNNAKM